MPGRAASVAVIVPVLGRPARVEPLIESIRTSSPYVNWQIIFVTSAGDVAEQHVVQDVIVRSWNYPPFVFHAPVEWLPGPGDYAKKINWAAQNLHETYVSRPDFLFMGADDLRFHPGWIEAAIATHLDTGACVIGTNDGGNSRVLAGVHSTHTLVTTGYLECGTADEPDSRKLLHEGYDHQHCDNEFIETAQHRRAYAHSHAAYVEHLHPLWGKSERDDTYAKAQRDSDADHRLFMSRQHLWQT